eukprot:403347370
MQSLIAKKLLLASSRQALSHRATNFYKILASNQLYQSQQNLINVRYFSSYDQEQPLSKSGSQQFDEDTNQVEQINNRAFNIAQQQYASDQYINNIMNEYFQVNQLQSYYNLHAKHFNLNHYSFLLYKINYIVKEQGKYATMTQEEKAEYLNKYGDPSSNSPEAANNLFKMIVSHLALNVKDIPVQTIVPVVRVLSDTKLDKSDFTESQLNALEKRVLDNYARFISMDMASIIHSFLNMNHVPNSLLNELNLMSSLTTFNKFSSILILEGLLKVKYTERQDLYEKLFNQLRKISSFMNQIISYRALNCVNLVKDLFPQKDYTDLAQFFIDKQVEYIRHKDALVQSDILYETIKVVKELETYTRVVKNNQLNIEKFSDNYLRIQIDKIEKSTPNYLFIVYESLISASDRKRYVDQILQSLKDQRTDIRKFDLKQLDSIITIVNDHSKKDIIVFYKYLEQCLDAGVFSQKHFTSNFDAVSRMLHLFVKEGYINAQMQTQFYYRYLMQLKDNMDLIKNDELIHVIWSLIVADDEQLQSPLIPRVYEKLAGFERDQPLTREEKLELHQIVIYCNELIKANQWPREFKDVVPRKVKDICEEEFNIFDKNHYQEVQMDIAKKLLKLRVTFQENAKINKSYRVDFKLNDVNKFIILKGPDMINQKNNELLGIQSLKFKHLQSKVKDHTAMIIDTEKWKNMSDDQQYEYLFALSRSKDSSLNRDSFDYGI